MGSGAVGHVARPAPPPTHLHARHDERQHGEPGAGDDEGGGRNAQLGQQGPGHPGVGHGQDHQAVHLEHLQYRAAVRYVLLVPA